MGGRGPADEPGELDPAHAVRPDLIDHDPLLIELLGEEIGRIAEAAARYEGAAGVGSRAWRRANQRIRACTVNTNEACKT